jgi:hypothetical protein
MTWMQDERTTASAQDRSDSAGAHVRLHRVYKVHHIGDTGVVFSLFDPQAPNAISG